MDGYAIRTSDFPTDAGLRLVGESAAGHGYAGVLKPGDEVMSLPAGRVGQPADCARAVLYLWTSEWVTGTVIDVDGGFLISK